MYDNEVERNAPRIIRAAIRSATRGDSRALIDVLNRVLGPPTQRVEMSGPGGAPLALQAAAPVALALMSTEELRAILGLQARLGLPDVQVQPVRDLLALRPPDGAPELLAEAPPPAAEPGPDGSPSLPLSLSPAPRSQDSPDTPQPPNPGEDIDPPTAGQDNRTPTADNGRGEDGPAPASHLSPCAAGGGQEAAEVRAEPAEAADVTLPSDLLPDSTLTPSQSGG